MKRLVLAVALIGLMALSTSAIMGFAWKPGDPCDSYGNCISTSLSLIRSNPDGTLYIGDSLSISVDVTTGPNTTGYSIYWSYDSSVFTRSGSTFTVTGNASGTFTITATADFSVKIKSGNSTTTITSSLSSSQSVVVVPLQIDILRLGIVNVTDGKGNVLRNPDGSFYRNDSFCVKFADSFSFSSVRNDIRVNITASSPSLIRTNTTSDALGRVGLVCFRVRDNAPYQPSKITFNFYAINLLGKSIAHRVSGVPFAVVQYDPHFTYFTYMLYNSRNFSTYYRPFVVLVRYDWNDPGYSYQGDINTARITSPKDYRERIWINNFTFSTAGWNVSLKQTGGVPGVEVEFNKTGNISNAEYRYLNSSWPIVYRTEAVMKYYFIGNVGLFRNQYYNVSISAWSKDFAGYQKKSIFNSSYLYEPVKYSGYLTFAFYGPYGDPDLTANITVVSHNPSPLNKYLIGRAMSIFGDDRAVMRAFERDLYQSNYTMTLKQLSGNLGGTITYLINQTNLALFPGEPLPWYNITVTSQFGSASFQYTPNGPPFLSNEQTSGCSSAVFQSGDIYAPSCSTLYYITFNDWGLYLINRSVITSLPFQNISAYYLLPQSTILMFPLNSTAGGSYASMLADSPAGPTINPFLTPSQVPGGLTRQYQMVYGWNTTVYINTGGGGILMEDRPQPIQGGRYYILDFLIQPSSGGMVSVVARSDRGTVLLNETLAQLQTHGNFVPSGYTGPLQLVVPAGDTNKSVSLTFTNAWGATTEISSIFLNPPPQQTAQFPWTLISLILVVFILLYIIRLSIMKRVSLA